MVEDWGATIKELGYESELAMWVDLYVERGWSIKRIADTLGYGTATIRRHLAQLDIQLRSRGGRRSYAYSKLKLLRMDPRIAVHGPILEAARLASVDKTTVWHFRRWVNENSSYQPNQRS